MEGYSIDNDVTGRFVTEKQNVHPNSKTSKELMKYLCRLITPKGGTVLDPFMGSGSTGISRTKRSIGIEEKKVFLDLSLSPGEMNKKSCTILRLQNEE